MLLGHEDMIGFHCEILHIRRYFDYDGSPSPANEEASYIGLEGRVGRARSAKKKTASPHLPALLHYL